MKKYLLPSWIVASIIGVFLITPVQAKSDYSTGMSAYMSGDYALAQQYWLQAAETGDARAMFNLGLLQERNMVSAASSENADQWFIKSGESGYAPADYHMALRLLEAGNQAESQVLMQRAADSGYLLAIEELQSPSVNAENAATVVKKPEPAPKPQSSESLNDTQPTSRGGYNRESWVLQQSPEFWTIQLLAFSNEQKVRNFIDDHGLHRGAAYVAEGDAAEPIYKLFYGSFATKEQADNARNGFTTALKEHGPWLRQIKAIQASINRP